MTTDPSNLPSTVEESLAICPQFRILLVGNTGVGKSSLVSNVFNITGLDIAQGRVGYAEINHEYTSLQNPRFILHDSKGFEPGSVTTLNIVQNFLQDRSRADRPLKERVHAIWLCLETPRTGSRIMETGDEELLSLADQLKIPVVIVFTKFDLLVNEKLKKVKSKPGEPLATRKAQAEGDATSDLDHKLSEYQGPKNFRDLQWVKVSTSNKYSNKNSMLRQLTKITRECLHETEGDLFVTWATAQQIHAKQKVDCSIEEGFKKYWVNLGKSTIFERQTTWDCLSRIHRDIVKVWNFYDPDNILIGDEISAALIKVVEPLFTQPESQIDSQLAVLGGTIVTAIGQFFPGLQIGVSAAKFLCSSYRKSNLTAVCFGAYIVDLLLILHMFFIDMQLTRDPPRPVEQQDVLDRLNDFQHTKARRIHDQVRGIVDKTPLRPEVGIAELIKTELEAGR